MGVRIIESNRAMDNYAVLYCSTSMWAFGPVFHEGYDEAQAFLDWLGVDPRGLSESELQEKYREFLSREKENAA